ncbi:MAG: HAD hydrolase-like protein [Trueperaceae bacterium]|nr:MAG: HAD hydrolase-like protein [Trueperaceae bacterium]
MVETSALLLFDIDGTLLLSDGAGQRAMLEAGRQLFGNGFDFKDLDTSGKIDPQIFAELVEANPHLEMAHAHDQFRDTYLQLLSIELGRSRVWSLPGITAALEVLSELEHVTLGLLTGNYGQAVPLKLRAAGLDPNLFAVTAFGDEAATRADLVALAQARYQERTGNKLPRERVIVIGDTPRDVECAHAHGCTAFAVATGRWEAEHLIAAGADHVVENLADLKPLLQLLA